MLAAFAGELAAVPLHALKHRWEAFNDATNDAHVAAETAETAETAADDASRRRRNRRFSVFSFWKDNSESPLELGMEAAADSEEHAPPSADDEDLGGQDLEDVPVEEPERKGENDRRSTNSSVSRADKPLPPAPGPDPSEPTSSRPRLGYVPAAMPTYERYPSQQSQQAEILQTDPRAVEADRMRNVVRQANEVYGDIQEAREKVRDRVRTVKSREGLRRREPLSSGSSSTRQARPINGRANSSSSSGQQGHGPIFKEPMPPPPQPRLSRSPPGTSYILAPPPAENYGQSSFGRMISSNLVATRLSDLCVTS